VTAAVSADATARSPSDSHTICPRRSALTLRGNHDEIDVGEHLDERGAWVRVFKRMSQVTCCECMMAEMLTTSSPNASSVG